MSRLCDNCGELATVGDLCADCDKMLRCPDCGTYTDLEWCDPRLCLIARGVRPHPDDEDVE